MRGFQRGAPQSQGQAQSSQPCSSTHGPPHRHSDPLSTQEYFTRPWWIPIFRLQWDVITPTLWNRLFKSMSGKEIILSSYISGLCECLFSLRSDSLCIKWHFQFTMYLSPSPIHSKIHSSLLIGSKISLSQSELPFSLKKWKISEEIVQQMQFPKRAQSSDKLSRTPVKL